MTPLARYISYQVLTEGKLIMRGCVARSPEAGLRFRWHVIGPTVTPDHAAYLEATYESTAAGILIPTRELRSTAAMTFWQIDEEPGTYMSAERIINKWRPAKWMDHVDRVFFEKRVLSPSASTPESVIRHGNLTLLLATLSIYHAAWAKFATSKRIRLFLGQIWQDFLKGCLDEARKVIPDIV